MAKTLPIAPHHTPGNHDHGHHGQGQHGPSRQSHGHHPAPHVFKKRVHHTHGKLIAGLSLALVALAVAAWLWLPGLSAPDPTETLLQQMHDAAGGNVAPTNVFGGTLTATRTNGRTTVTAAGLSSKACVQAGWRLSKEGTIIVDGVLPVRLSAGKLAELCAGDTATLTWISDE